MANKYEVKISYIRFTFSDRNKAMNFAETALDALTDENRTVEIKVSKEQEENQEVEE